MPTITEKKLPAS